MKLEEAAYFRANTPERVLKEFFIPVSDEEGHGIRWDTIWIPKADIKALYSEEDYIEEQEIAWVGVNPPFHENPHERGLWVEYETGDDRPNGDWMDGEHFIRHLLVRDELGRAIFKPQVNEGFKHKALAGVLSTLLAFSNAGAEDVYLYTDDDGQTQVAKTYADVPKGKMARIVDVEDLLGQFDIDEIQQQVRDQWKTQDLDYRNADQELKLTKPVYKGPAKFRAKKDRLSPYMFRKDI